MKGLYELIKNNKVVKENAPENDGQQINIAALTAMSAGMKNHLSLTQMSSSVLLPYAEQSNSNQLKEYAAMNNRSYFNVLRMANNLEVLGSQINMQYSKVDLVRLCREVVDTCSELLDNRKAELRFHSAQKKVIVSADVDRITQMLLNIISNSLINTEKDGIIHVSVSLQHAGAFIKVSDTGCGIASDIIGSIWHRYSEPEILTDAKSGAGFGMSVISKIANMHGGNAFIESRDIGTTVVVSLPADRTKSLEQNNATEHCHIYDALPFLIGLAPALDSDKYAQKYMD